MRRAYSREPKRQSLLDAFFREVRNIPDEAGFRHIGKQIEAVPRKTAMTIVLTAASNTGSASSTQRATPAQSSGGFHHHVIRHFAVNAKSYDAKLFEMLKNLRKKLAKDKNLPPYVLFQDPSLEEMATTYPTTKEEMAQVNGVGMGKVNKFGGEFLSLIKSEEIATIHSQEASLDEIFIQVTGKKIGIT